MSPQKGVKNSQTLKRSSPGSNSYQTNLLAWKLKGELSTSKSTSKLGQDNSVEDDKRADDQAEDALQVALRYFDTGKIVFLMKVLFLSKYSGVFLMNFKAKHIVAHSSFCLFNRHLFSTYY